MTDEHLPYGRQSIDKNDVEAVLDVLESDWLTTGPTVDKFENRFANFVDADHAVATSNGTAALHAAVHAAGIGDGDEVVTSPMTFTATANAVLYEGARPVFADVDPDTLLLDPDAVAEQVTDRTEAILAVDYAGQPCDWDALAELAADHDLTLIADSAHALGAAYRGEPVGSVADLTAFSFHPVKHITTAEGGMVTTDNEAAADAIRRFRDHGRQVPEDSPGWYYEVVELGRNYRLSDLQCALGITQLEKLPEWLAGRRDFAARYDEELATIDGVEPLAVRDDVEHAYHLYVARFTDAFPVDRDDVYEALRERNVGVQVHYIPVHLHPYYQETLGTEAGDCPVAEQAYDEILSLPLFPEMEADDVGRVVDALEEIAR